MMCKSKNSQLNRFFRVVSSALLISSILLMAPVIAEDKSPFDILNSEQLGALKLDMAMNKVKLPTGCGKPVKEKEIVWGADGAWHQDWVYKSCGLTLGLWRDHQKAAQTVFSLSIKSPSQLKTKRGIGIGSTAQAVLKAYAKEYNAEESQKNLTIVVGSIYGGVIFTLRQGKVTEIFMGAAAE